MSKKTRVEEVTLTFDLHELPTAQHRAGLAGLIFQIDAMGRDGYRRADKIVPVIKDLTATSAMISFIPDSMQGVFNELYAAKLAEVVVATKWPGETKPKPGVHFVSKKDPETGEVKEVPGFAYDVVQPQSPALMRHLAGGREAWLELWRQMLWAIPRGGNNVRSRAPFIDLANHRPCGEGATAWVQIVDFHKGLARSRFKTEPISGALMLGAQAINAEGVPFSGRVDHNLLLHFWQLVVLTFVPQVVSKKDAKVERIGYVLAIPDVANLIEFRAEFPEILQGLEAKDPKHTPAKARLDLPAQAGLETLRRLRDVAQTAAKKASSEPENVELAKLAESSAGEGKPFAKRLLAGQRRDQIDRRNTHQALATGKAAREWGHCVRAVETYHMLKLGNNVKLLTFSRVADRAGLVEDYERIDGLFRNPLFRAARMRSLLQRRPWYWGMIELFAEYPWSFFIEGDETPQYLSRFGRDAKDQFRANYEDIKGMASNEMNEDEKLKRLGSVVQRLINRYVEGRAEVKTGKKVSSFGKKPLKDKGGEWIKVKKTGEIKQFPVYPDDFLDAIQRVYSDAFLAMRSRHDQEFVHFFTGSVCSVAQDLRPADYQLLIETLMTPSATSPVAEHRPCWEDIKAIAMVALSACSFEFRKHDPKNEGNPS